MRMKNRKGTIQAPDGSVWTYEIGHTGDNRLIWVLRAPDNSWRSSIAPAQATVSHVERGLRTLVYRMSLN
jgi:hypothetical protein